MIGVWARLNLQHSRAPGDEGVQRMIRAEILCVGSACALLRGNSQKRRLLSARICLDSEVAVVVRLA